MRNELLQRIDWDCEVTTLFREKNAGCKHAMSNGIDWFFKHEEEGIILEDDCLPSRSFFFYCEELLEKYRSDDSVYLISGQNIREIDPLIESDYGFTKFALIWGWASWRSVWKMYDVHISDWPANKNEILKRVSPFLRARLFWLRKFDTMHDQKVDTWDYQLSYLILKDGGRTIIPKKNLISNIGFDDRGTHTKNPKSDNANIPRYELDFPLKGPKDPKEEQRINRFYDLKIYSERNLIKILKGFKDYFLTIR